MTSNDEMERQRFENWWRTYFKVITKGKQTHLYETVKETSWMAWQAALKSKQGEV